MIELGAMKRDSIVKLCEDSRISLVRAAAEGKGRAFVPTLESPSCCLVLTGGFSYLVGMPPRGAASLDLYHVLAKECGDTSILADDVRWDEWIETKFSGRFRTVSRYLLRAPEEGFDFEALERRIEVPAEYEIREVTAPLFKRLGELRFSENLTASFADADVFAACGIGYVALQDKVPVSACLAYVHSEEIMDVKAATEKGYRQKGLASASGASLLLRFRDKARIPDWDADSLFSASLGERLGYHTEREYKVYQIAVE